MGDTLPENYIFICSRSEKQYYKRILLSTDFSDQTDKVGNTIKQNEILLKAPWMDLSPKKDEMGQFHL